MTVLLSDSELDQLLPFIRYDTLEADVWFLGMEEAGGREDNLRKRLKFRPVEDCAQAHKILGIEKHYWGKRIIQRTWRGMCCIMLGLTGKEITSENIRAYQAECLGCDKGNTLLAELMPIPRPAFDQWDYEALIPQFPSKEAYYQQVNPNRIQLFRQLVGKHRPKVVIGYGKAWWPDYKQIFVGAPFTRVDPFEVAKSDSSLVVLRDHFTARSMNNKFDQIVSIIKHGRQNIRLKTNILSDLPFKISLICIRRVYSL